MRRWRRSWFEPPRWRVEIAVGVMVLAAAVGLAVARGTDVDTWFLTVVVLTGSLVAGAVQRRRAHSVWRGLQVTSPVSDAELLEAERAVRDHVVPGSECVLREAVRIADLRHDLDGGAVLIPVLNALLTAVSVALAIRSGGLWWVAPPSLAAVTAVDWSHRRRFVRHRLRLQAAAGATPEPARLTP